MSSSPGLPSRTGRNIRLVQLYVGAMHFAPFLTVWVLYLTDQRGLSLTQVAVMEAFFWGVSMVAEIPTGAFADRFGRKRTFLVGSSVEALGILAFGLAQNFELLLASYVLWATGIAFGTGNAEAFLYDTMAERDLERSYSKQLGRMHAAMIASGLVGGALGAGVAALTTLQAPILAGVSVYAIALVLAARMDEPERVSSEQDGAGTTYARTLANATRLVWRSPALRYIILFSVVVNLGAMTEWILLQPFLAAHDVPVGLFGLVIVPIRLAAIAGSLGGYRYFELLGIRQALAGTFIATLGGLLLLALVDHVAAVAGVVAIQFANALRRPSVNAYINERTSSAVRATVLSVTPFGMSLSLVLTLPFVGLAADDGIRMAFGLLEGVILLVGGGALLLWLRADREPEEALPLAPPALAPGP